MVTITGNDFQQCRAQYMIYTRIAEQQQVYLDDVKLRTEVVVPSRLVGRIIGKGGQNVKELQRITGTTVKIPEDEPKVETLDENCREGMLCSLVAFYDYRSGVEGTIVRIIGNCHGSSSVQYRISWYNIRIGFQIESIFSLINEFSRTTIHDRRREDNNGSFSSFRCHMAHLFWKKHRHDHMPIRFWSFRQPLAQQAHQSLVECC